MQPSLFVDKISPASSLSLGLQTILVRPTTVTGSQSGKGAGRKSRVYLDVAIATPKDEKLERSCGAGSFRSFVSTSSAWRLSSAQTSSTWRTPATTLPVSFSSKVLHGEELRRYQSESEFCCVFACMQRKLKLWSRGQLLSTYCMQRNLN